MLEPLGGLPLVEAVFRRCQTSRQADWVAVLTSEDPSDDPLAGRCAERGVECFRGALDDVLGRYVAAAEGRGVDWIGRVCGDSPFVDVELLDGMFAAAEEGGWDYLVPDKSGIVAGLDSEVVALAALQSAACQTREPRHREHVTSFIRETPGQFRMKTLAVDLRPEAVAGAVLTVDRVEDLTLCRRVREGLAPGFDFSSAQVLAALERAIASAAGRSPG